MSIHLARPTALANDRAIAELHNQTHIYPESPEEFYKREMQTPHNSYYRRVVAKNKDDIIVGTSLVRSHWEQYSLSVKRINGGSGGSSGDILTDEVSCCKLFL